MTGQSVSANERIFYKQENHYRLEDYPRAGPCGLLLAIWIPLNHKSLASSPGRTHRAGFYLQPLSQPLLCTGVVKPEEDKEEGGERRDEREER